MVLGDLRDTAGRASYDILAAAVVGRSPALDLACGDGPLIEAVGAGTFVIGGDRSEAELRAARERLGDRAPLLQVAATALPVRDAVLACVACHFALMLLQPVENVIQEIRRVLRPGGRLVLTVPAASGVEGGVWQALRTAMAAATAVERFRRRSRTIVCSSMSSSRRSSSRTASSSSTDLTTSSVQRSRWRQRQPASGARMDLTCLLHRLGPGSTRCSFARYDVWHDQTEPSTSRCPCTGSWPSAQADDVASGLRSRGSSGATRDRSSARVLARLSQH